MSDLFTVGWREWVSLPDLEISLIKAKVDTGARTSCLHAFDVRPFTKDGVHRVEFSLHPNQRDLETVQICTADVLDRRTVMDSGGHQEDRWVILTTMGIGPHSWPIEVTLSARDDMRFRMLLGRNAIKNRALVDSAKSYQVGKKPKKRKKKKASKA